MMMVDPPAEDTTVALRRTAPARPREATRARYPDIEGIAERDGGRIAYEVYGAGEPPVVLVPPWQIVHSRVWKAQIPDLARRHRVVAWDARGNGRSDRPNDPAVHPAEQRAADLEAVMDAAGVGAAILVGLSAAARPMVVFAAEHPQRVLGLVFICPSSPFGEPLARPDPSFEDPLDDATGWNLQNIHAWRREFRSYLEFFFEEAFPEPHSTKQREDAVGYGLDTDPEALAATVRAVSAIDQATFARMCASITKPALIIQGTDDRIAHVTQGTGLARAIPGARVALLEGAGHIPNSRDPVRVNLLLREFIASVTEGSRDARP